MAPKQLEDASDKLIHDFGESPRQNILVLDINSTTHSLESRKREKAVVGRNKKNRGKSCYQWSVAFVRGEVVSQKPKIDSDKWIEYNSDTKLYDLGRIKIISTTENIFRAILVDIRQHPLGEKRAKKKHIQYAIIENLAIELNVSDLTFTQEEKFRLLGVVS